MKGCVEAISIPVTPRRKVPCFRPASVFPAVKPEAGGGKGGIWTWKRGRRGKGGEDKKNRCTTGWACPLCWPPVCGKQFSKGGESGVWVRRGRAGRRGGPQAVPGRAGKGRRGWGGTEEIVTRLSSGVRGRSGSGGEGSSGLVTKRKGGSRVEVPAQTP